jgi:hypothetical protein
MELIYLVGQISPKFEVTYQWRKNVENKFWESEEIKFINPCNNPFNKKVLEEKEYAVSQERRVDAIDVLPAKDYTFCKRSTMAIVNMNHYDPAKPLLGSYFELSWYFTMPEKTVIGFAEDLNDYECQHPFVQQTVTTWCRDEYEAAAIVKQYFTTVNGI